MGKSPFPDPDLIPDEIAKDIPKLRSTSEERDPTAHVKLFTPDSSWSWYVTEYDKKEKVGFGLVYGHEAEIGYFSIEEMQSVRGPLGLPIERDTSFKPKPLSQCHDPCNLHDNPLRSRRGLDEEGPQREDQGEEPAQEQKKGQKLKI